MEMSLDAYLKIRELWRNGKNANDVHNLIYQLLRRKNYRRAFPQIRNKIKLENNAAHYPNRPLFMAFNKLQSAFIAMEMFESAMHMCKVYPREYSFFDERTGKIRELNDDTDPAYMLRRMVDQYDEFKRSTFGPLYRAFESHPQMLKQLKSKTTAWMIREMTK